MIALAVLAGLLAADILSWSHAAESGDVAFIQSPESAHWAAATTLPFDPALRILDLSNQLAFRRAATSFVSVQAAGNGLDNGYSESRTRGALETVLTEIAQGPDAHIDSEAENLLGILAFSDSKQNGPNAPAPVERSVSDFQAAVRLDPTNEDAKFNLEWLLRQLVAKGVRLGSNSSNGGPGKGHQGAGGGLPGKGY
jgi:hypothetical protein